MANKLTILLAGTLQLVAAILYRERKVDSVPLRNGMSRALAWTSRFTAFSCCPQMGEGEEGEWLWYEYQL